jgi:hypothetical protein
MPSRLARVICVANSYRTLVRLSPSFSAGIIGQVVRVVSFGGDGRAFDVVHNGSDAAVAETAAVQLAKLSGLSPEAERGLSFTPPNDGDDWVAITDRCPQSLRAMPRPSSHNQSTSQSRGI